MFGPKIGTLFFVCLFVACSALAQNPAPLNISPNEATMLLGETRSFRAVGKDGRMRHNVRWSISPEHAAAIHPQNDEVVVTANEVSTSVTLTAYAEGDSAEATIEIRDGKTLPAGTKIWSVAPSPGCKNKQIVQAVPSATGPDLYVLEDCPQGTVIRALDAEGHEMWRKVPGQADYKLPLAGARSEHEGQRLNPHASSVCDQISLGMSKEEAAKTIDAMNASLNPRQKATDSWLLEEDGFRCAISFDAKSSTVVKKKKTVVTD